MDLVALSPHTGRGITVGIPCTARQREGGADPSSPSSHGLFNPGGVAVGKRGARQGGARAGKSFGKRILVCQGGGDGDPSNSDNETAKAISTPNLG